MRSEINSEKHLGRDIGDAVPIAEHLVVLDGGDAIQKGQTPKRMKDGVRIPTLGKDILGNGSTAFSSQSRRGRDSER